MHIDAPSLAEAKRILAFWADGIPAFAFGSRVHGRGLKAVSDLDLCLRGDGPIPDAQLRQISNAFEVSTIPYRVDIVDWHALTSDFQQLIAPDLVAIATAHAEA